MKNYLIPAVMIITVTLLLVAINEFTEISFIKDYALLFIIGGVLSGIWISRRYGKAKGEG
jgi:positive regulator of sigma E activity